MFRILIRLLPCLLMMGICSPCQAQLLYGISNGFGTAANNHIYQIDPTNADLTSSVQVLLPGFTVGRSLAMASSPIDGTLYAVLQTSVDSATLRRLVTINPVTGTATNIGTLPGSFSSLAFRANGTLYGVTGVQGANANTLYIINTNTAVTTLQFALTNVGDGETIAFHPNGLLYNASGSLLRSINVDTQAVTNIGGSGSEMFAMGYYAGLGQLLGSDISSNLFSIDIATGAQTAIGAMSDQLSGSDNRGLASLAIAVPEPTTLALAGSSMMALALYGNHRWKNRKPKVSRRRS